ncbi:uncharacterized protein LOC114841689 [Diachasma alloeum]|uniref:uncharacterized protein LOC114841689 n=1 Tax=Diachasma alloeum TaxID=454923 RepID=UPI0010FB4E26|nr:uncharacterized protein LOC114841689 [Diachasma alloeum]
MRYDNGRMTFDNGNISDLVSFAERYEEIRSKRSLSSPQLFQKPLARSKVYRKASLKSSSCEVRRNSMGRCSGKGRVRKREDEVREEGVHIICNPLATQYPYATPFGKGKDLEVGEDEPKCSHSSCGGFLPIFSLIPQGVVSLQYLSPKMKFSWWRNKIS